MITGLNKMVKHIIHENVERGLNQVFESYDVPFKLTDAERSEINDHIDAISDKVISILDKRLHK